MRKIGYVLLAAILVTSPLIAKTDHGKDQKDEKQKQEVKTERIEAQRAQIDTMARKSLDRLFVEEPESRSVYDDSYGYAVFDTTKVALGVSGGGGSGVAVVGNRRQYMKMATAGVGVGVGAQNYQLILLFENERSFNKFVSEGWNAEASADAGAGDHGESESETSEGGITIFKLADEGLIANADVSGTRFWKADKLN